MHKIWQLYEEVRILMISYNLRIFAPGGGGNRCPHNTPKIHKIIWRKDANYTQSIIFQYLLHNWRVIRSNSVTCHVGRRDQFVLACSSLQLGLAFSRDTMYIHHHWVWARKNKKMAGVYLFPVFMRNVQIWSKTQQVRVRRAPLGGAAPTWCCVSFIFEQFAYTPGYGVHQPFSYFFGAQTRWWCIYMVSQFSFLLG